MSSDAWWTGRPAIRMTRWIPNEPTPRQQAFLWLDCLEALYGGAAGGGKSIAMLMGALQYVDVPHYAALLIRRSYPELAQPGGLMARSHEWLLDTDAHWDGNQHRWTFPSGATISFGHLNHELDKYKFAGSEFQYIGVDEASDLRVEDVNFLFSRLRKPSVGPLSQVPLRMRLASNPGGRSHMALKRRYMADESLEKGRIYIPASLYENPYIDQDAYVKSLSELDEQTRKQLMDGDWNARPPGAWMLDHRHIEAAVKLGEQWREDYESYVFHGTEDFPEPAGGEIAIGVDFGEHTQGYVIWPLEKGGVYIPSSEVVQYQGEPGEFTDKMVQKALYTGMPLGEFRYDAAGIQSARTFVRRVREVPEWELDDMRTTKIPFSKYKYATIGYMRWLLARSFKAVQANKPPIGVMAIDPGNELLIDQLYQWQRKDEDSDQAVKENDHGPDAVVAGVAPIADRHRSRMVTEREKAAA